MQETGWLGLKVSEWIMIGAVIAGPILAVWVTRLHDWHSANKKRQLDVLRALLKTRQTRIDPEHVGALNLIEIEFYDNQPIVTAYTNYINHLSAPLPIESARESFFRERHDLFVILLHKIGAYLGYHFDKLDLERRGYSPVIWLDDQDRQRQNAALITELLEGRRSLPIFNLQSAQGLFPPPPTKDGK